MDQASFTSTEQSIDDPVARILKSLSQGLLVLTLGLSPILFLPLQYSPVVFSKVLLVLFGVVISIVLYGLYLLREGNLQLKVTTPQIAIWLVVLASFLSALFSADMYDSMMGDFMAPHSVAFMALVAVIVSSLGILRGSKKSVMRLYFLFILSAVAITLFHFLRLFFGSDFLTLNVFSASTSTPLGGWNDLALFLGLVLLLSLLALSQLPLTKVGKSILGLVSAVSLLLLAIINFYAIWIVLGLVSLIVLIYNLTQKNSGASQQLGMTKERSGSIGAVLMALVLTLVSGLFLVSGSSIGAISADLTGISYVEVRPSFSATFDITSQALSDNPIFGIGPNKFVDAWRLYKDPVINQTIFWNTPFQSANSFVTTAIVETGIIGLITWLLFFGSIIFLGFRLLFSNAMADSFWRFVGMSSLVATLYFWGMSIIYVPNAATLLLTAVCTGVFLVSFTTVIPTKTYRFSINQENKAQSFVYVGAVIVVLISVVSSTFFATQYFTTLHQFNKTVSSINPGDSLDNIEAEIARLFSTVKNDAFPRQIALYKQAQLSALLGITEPTEADSQAFARAITGGINAGQVSTQYDVTEPLNWQVLGQIYLLLSASGVDGAYERGKEALQKAIELSPTNPLLTMRMAELEFTAGNRTEARAMAEATIRLRPQFTEAIFLLTQLDVDEGNVVEAIGRVRDLISLEPQNEVRYYQLGVLLASNADSQGAIQALERAVALNDSYANARYILALQYLDNGRNDEAIAELEAVRGLNPENAGVNDLIDNIRSGEFNGALDLPDETVSEPAEEEGEAVSDISTEDIESNLLTPVNIVPDAGEEEVEPTEEAVEEAETPDTEEQTSVVE